MRELPRIVFVLGKGGVGRSTVATGLALALAGRKERVLVLEWAVAEAIAPWFDLPPAGTTPSEVAPGVLVANYDLDEALRAYFVDHLKVAFFYRHVVHGPSLRRLIEAAPGVAEMLFLGQLWWLTTLAEKEAGLRFDRIVVDAPATGHGVSLLDLPETLASMAAGGLLRREVERVTTMMSDPASTGAFVVALPEELAIEETLELVPRATKALGRSPLLAIVNRSATRVMSAEAQPSWLTELGEGLSAPARESLATLHAELRDRVSHEAELRRALEGATRWGTVSIDEMLALTESTSPREVATSTAAELGAWLDAPHHEEDR
jgi:anion-transporting  ArsA/GET3 family ATPase